MPTSRDDAGSGAPSPDAAPEPPSANQHDDDVILLEDLTPRSEVKGGRTSRVFGEDSGQEGLPG